MTGIAAAVTYACWGLVVLTWAIGAALTRWRGLAVQRRDGRDAASWIAALAAVLILITPDGLWRPITVDRPAVVLTGIAVLPVATLGTMWARVALGRMWSSAAVARRNHELRTNGPYGITRHPIYTGVLTMLAGTALTEGLGRWTVLFVAVTILLVRKARTEERLLAAKFGATYRSYQQRVPQLIHGLRWRNRRSAR